MILIIDNYDSFVHNLARYVRQLGLPTTIVRNDKIDRTGVKSLAPQAIILSPGPCDPDDAGCCLELVKSLHQSIPILGVCLGHQVIVQALGGKIVRAEQPMHGRASEIRHSGSRLFQDIPATLTVGRYHSLIADPASLPACLAVTSATNDQTIMSVEHRDFPVVGMQFHPESILTQHGHLLIRNFLRIADCIQRDSDHTSNSVCQSLAERETVPSIPAVERS